MSEIVKPLAVTKDKLTVSGLQASSKLDPPKLTKVVPPKESTSLSHSLSPDSRAAYMIARMQSDRQKTDISAQTQVLPKIAEQNEATNVPVQNVQSQSGINLQPSAPDVAVQHHSSLCTFSSSSLAHGPDHVVSNTYLVQ